MALDTKLIGNNIRKIRKNAKKSQEAFAEKIEASVRTISNIENGTVLPSINTLYNIAQSFGCSVDSLITEPDD